MTVGESLLNCLKKGKGEEQALAAQVVAIIILQIAGIEDPEIEGELGFGAMVSIFSPCRFVCICRASGLPVPLVVLAVLSVCLRLCGHLCFLFTAGMWTDMRTVMQLILQDRQASPTARAACASTLGLGSVIVGGQDEQYR